MQERGSRPGYFITQTDVDDAYEVANHIETVRLGEDFLLFPSGKLDIELPQKFLTRKIGLIDAVATEAFPVGISLSPVVSRKSQIYEYMDSGFTIPYMTPLSPSNGYIISEDDFESAKRITKMREFAGTSVDYDVATFVLGAHFDNDDLLKFGAVDPDTLQIRVEAMSFFDRLRFQVRFPTNELELYMTPVGDQFFGGIEFSSASFVGRRIAEITDNPYKNSRLHPKIAVSDPRSLRENNVTGRFILTDGYNQMLSQLIFGLGS